MRTFEISRTSDWQGKNKPCKKAKKLRKNEFGETRYVIDINSLEELIEVLQEVGSPLIMSEHSLEIYDDWRE